MFDILRTRKGRLKDKIMYELEKENPSVDVILKYVDDYEKANLETITKLKKGKKVEINRINGALKQTINAHSIITKELIGSASKRIYGALLVNEKSKKEKFYEKISSIYHTFVNSLIFIIKLQFMKENKSKISVTISKVNDKKLNDKSINKSKLIDKLLTDYFKNGEK